MLNRFFDKVFNNAKEHKKRIAQHQENKLTGIKGQILNDLKLYIKTQHPGNNNKEYSVLFTKEYMNEIFDSKAIEQIYKSFNVRESYLNEVLPKIILGLFDNKLLTIENLVIFRRKAEDIFGSKFIGEIYNSVNIKRVIELIKQEEKASLNKVSDQKNPQVNLLKEKKHILRKLLEKGFDPEGAYAIIFGNIFNELHELYCLDISKGNMLYKSEEEKQSIQDDVNLNIYNTPIMHLEHLIIELCDRNALDLVTLNRFKEIICTGYVSIELELAKIKKHQVEPEPAQIKFKK